MLTIKECERILNRDGNQYTDEQLTAIRDYISELAEVYVQNTKNIHNEKDSSNLY